MNAAQRYGSWITLHFSHLDKKREAYWLCRCDCGNQRAVSLRSLRRGQSLSCGCQAGTKISIGRIARFGDPFTRYTVTAAGCWEWQGRKARKMGYGVMHKRGTRRDTMLAHRAFWEHYRGTIPAERCVLHKCDNPPCCNPDHLFLGTQRDNVHDMISKGRGRLQREAARRRSA
jgi:hypothetical protein